MDLPENYLAVFETARRYDEGGDLYHAVKLYKKTIRLNPEFSTAYRHLGMIYAGRKEWKPAFHYWKKAVSLDTDDRDAWWQMGLAATALKKLRIAQSIWSKFGLENPDFNQPLGLRLKHADGFEILWMQPLDAARCRILSIPHPGSDLRFRQMMLYDRRGEKGFNVVKNHRIPVFDAVDRLKGSPYQTFSCLLHTSETAAIDRLERLCHDAGLGFEVWSNASRSLTFNQASTFPEYYNDILPKSNNGATLVAMAALHPAEVERVLNNWQIIHLEQYSDLRAY
jgi:tetratricopeptide (TPR) repeat protein